MKLNLKERKVLYSGKHFEFLTKIFISDGKEEECEYIRAKGGNSNIVSIIPITSKKEIILIRQFRGPREKTIIEFPTGKGDKKESLIDAAKRELFEETGFNAGKLIKLVSGPLSPGATDSFLTYFLAVNLERGERPKASDLGEATIELLFVPLNEAEDFLKKQPQILGVSTLEVDVTLLPMIAYVKNYIVEKLTWDLV